MSVTVAKEYDVVIVGCGIAGSVVGAILSKMAHKKVLILEASSQIGGRATSFRGEGIVDAGEFRKTLATSAHSWVSDRSEPDLPTMIEKKLLHGYTLEAGGRGSWYTNRGRVSQALAVFNKPSIFIPMSALSGMTTTGSLLSWDGNLFRGGNPNTRG